MFELKDDTKSIGMWNYDNRGGKIPTITVFVLVLFIRYIYIYAVNLKYT